MASIRWSVGAGEDLREVVEYIARDSTIYAAAMASRIVTAVEKLQRHGLADSSAPAGDERNLAG